MINQKLKQLVLKFLLYLLIGFAVAFIYRQLRHCATTKLVEKNKKMRLAAAKKTIVELEKDKY